MKHVRIGKLDSDHGEIRIAFCVLPAPTWQRQCIPRSRLQRDDEFRRIRSRRTPCSVNQLQKSCSGEAVHQRSLFRIAPKRKWGIY